MDAGGDKKLIFKFVWPYNTCGKYTQGNMMVVLIVGIIAYPPYMDLFVSAPAYIV